MRSGATASPCREREGCGSSGEGVAWRAGSCISPSPPGPLPASGARGCWAACECNIDTALGLGRLGVFHVRKIANTACYPCVVLALIFALVVWLIAGDDGVGGFARRASAAPGGQSTTQRGRPSMGRGA